MRPNMDLEIAVLESVLANAKDQHQLKAGLAQAVTLLRESTDYAGSCLRLLQRARVHLPITLMDELDVLLAKNPVNAEPSASTQSAGTTESALNPGPSNARTEIVRPNGGMETALLEDIDRMREKIHVMGDTLKRIKAWDVMNPPTEDGSDVRFWRSEIDKALSFVPVEYRGHAVGNPQPHVAWLRINNYNGRRAATIHVCDSDAPGAFKVYRAVMPAPVAVGAEREALANALAAAKDYGYALATFPPGSDYIKQTHERVLAAEERCLSQGIVQPKVSGRCFRCGLDVTLNEPEHALTDAEVNAEFKRRNPPPPNPQAPTMKEAGNAE